MRRPPCSPLFPYTTLFRSSRWQARAGGPTDGAESRAGTSRGGTAAAGSMQAGAGGPTDGAGGDRKSTRLNSSHPSISYAVFCLKKKKIKKKTNAKHHKRRG